MDYLGRLLSKYPSFTLDYVEDGLPMAKGWALIAWAIENDGWLQFAGVQRVSDGYIKQEMKRLSGQN